MSSGVTSSYPSSDRVAEKIREFNIKGEINSHKNKKSKKKFIPITISESGLELIEFISIDATSSSGEWHSDSEIKIDKNGYVSINNIPTKAFWDGTLKSDKKPLRIKIRNICGDEVVMEVNQIGVH